MPILGPAVAAKDRTSGVADIWAYEQIFVTVSFVGVGIGLAVVFAGYAMTPGYAMTRWPEALGGPIDCGEHAGHTRQWQVPPWSASSRLAVSWPPGSPIACVQLSADIRTMVVGVSEKARVDCGPGRGRVARADG